MYNTHPTESQTPYFLDPNLHLVCIHPAFLLCRNNDAVLVVDLRQSFSLEDNHGLKFSAVSSTRQHDRDPILLVSRGTNFHGLLADVNFSLVVYFAKVNKNHSQPSFCFLVYGMLMRM